MPTKEQRERAYPRTKRIREFVLTANGRKMRAGEIAEIMTDELGEQVTSKQVHNVRSVLITQGVLSRTKLGKQLQARYESKVSQNGHAAAKAVVKSDHGPAASNGVPPAKKTKVKSMPVPPTTIMNLPMDDDTMPVSNGSSKSNGYKQLLAMNQDILQLLQTLMARFAEILDS